MEAVEKDGVEYCVFDLDGRRITIRLEALHKLGYEGRCPDVIHANGSEETAMPLVEGDERRLEVNAELLNLLIEQAREELARPRREAAESRDELMRVVWLVVLLQSMTVALLGIGLLLFVGRTPP